MIKLVDLVEITNNNVPIYISIDKESNGSNDIYSFKQLGYKLEDFKVIDVYPCWDDDIMFVVSYI